jgi:hypothetical protein
MLQVRSLDYVSEKVKEVEMRKLVFILFITLVISSASMAQKIKAEKIRATYWKSNSTDFFKMVVNYPVFGTNAPDNCNGCYACFHNAKVKNGWFKFTVKFRTNKTVSLGVDVYSVAPKVVGRKYGAGEHTASLIFHIPQGVETVRHVKGAQFPIIMVHQANTTVVVLDAYVQKFRVRK